MDPPIRPRLRGRRGELVDLLGRQIGSGQIAPGTIIDPDEIGRRLDVSRTVVREAFQVLVSKGMLDPRPRVGTRVAQREDWDVLDHDVIVWQLDSNTIPADLPELLELGRCVEPFAARRAAASADHLAIGAQLLALCAVYEHQLATADFDSYCASDIEFHTLIARAGGSAIFRRMAGTITAVMVSRNRLGLMTEVMSETTIDMHRRIAKAVADGDGDLAEQAMAEMLHAASCSVASAGHGGR